MFERLALPRAGALLATVALCTLSVGCDGSAGNRLSGTVTFDGNPVPAGKVYISPDASKGNEGHTGWADIKDGKYDTGASGGQGVPSGPVVIAVEGLDPNAPAEKAGGEDVVAKLLFARYETRVDLPDGESTQDIVVPKEAAASNVSKPEVFVPGP